ncbi:aminodeoxychorismate synthase component I [Candidatus Marinamargulisbacteria bacterium SCGC AAA071-K20]|nr:aminodeoxychorismate synthase component I [Candidatus Marinamargulisbacteria bacterium SCGC AAA071-K20]
MGFCKCSQRRLFVNFKTGLIVTSVQQKYKCDFNYLSLLESFCDDPYLVCLDSSSDDSKYSQFSYIAFDPFMKIVVENKTTNIIKKNQSPESSLENPFDLINTYLKKYNDSSLIPFTAGAIGYFSYEAAQYLNDFTVKNRSLDCPEINLGFYDKVFVFDHKKNELFLYVTQFSEHSSNFDINDFLSDLSISSAKTQPYKIEAIESETSKESYSKKVKSIKQYIENGDIYQANLTCKYSGAFSGSILGLYKILRKVSPAPYSAFLNTGFGSILSSSPELLLSLEGSTLTTRPIKGTISRGSTFNEDEKNKQTLKSSLKDRAELLMIIDLERNDLSKVCCTGSVKVSELMSLESYKYLHHLVSTISGRLKSELSQIDAFKAVFPGGSITGAPKIRATEIIQDLEETSRNSYTGSIGFFSFDGSLKCNIAIRTMYKHNESINFHVGGGIVADSNVDSEWQETITKAEGMLIALKQAERTNQ